jgi:hypothetical protein
VGVRIKDVLDRLGGESLDDLEEFLRAAGIVGVHDDEVVVHLDDRCVAVALAFIANKEPDAGSDLKLRCGLPRRGLRGRSQGGGERVLVVNAAPPMVIARRNA